MRRAERRKEITMDDANLSDLTERANSDQNEEDTLICCVAAVFNA